jgi:hypothetical protein
MQRLIGSFLILLLLLGAAADRVSVVELILRLPSWVQFAVGWLTPPEEWLIEQQIHVLPLALAVLVFFLLVVTPGDMRRWMGGWRRRNAPDTFWQSAAGSEQRDAAEEFRWSVERCYRRYAEATRIANDAAALIRLIDGLRFPADFPGAAATPLPGNSGFGAWPTPEGNELWAFARDLFDKMLRAPSGDYLGIDTTPFLKAQRRAARFWDDCGHMLAGRHGSRRWRREIAAHARDIKILALFERARIDFLPWDENDRAGLFRLAAGL